MRMMIGLLTLIAVSGALVMARADDKKAAPDAPKKDSGEKAKKDAGGDKKEPVSEEAKKDMKALEGEWSMVSSMVNGMPLPEIFMTDMKLTFKDDEITAMLGPNRALNTKYKLDPAKKPKEIDYQPRDPSKGKPQLGIYELEGDALKICYAVPGRERPSDFTAKMGSDRTFTSWKKNKK